MRVGWKMEKRRCEDTHCEVVQLLGCKASHKTPGTETPTNKYGSYGVQVVVEDVCQQTQRVQVLVRITPIMKGK